MKLDGEGKASVRAASVGLSSRHSMRRMFGVGAAASLLALTAACGSSDSSSSAGGDVKVMILAPISLASAPYQNALDAVNARFNQLNKDGGVGGHKVKVIGCDSQGDVNVAAQCARKAVSEGVVAFVGNQDYNGSSIWPIIEKAGIPSIGVRQVNDFDNTNKFAFPIDASGPLTYGVAGAYLTSKEGCKTVGWMGVDYGAASQAAIDQSKAAVKKVGGTWGSTQLFGATAADLAPQAVVALRKGDCFILAAGNLSPRAAQALYAINPNVKLIGTPDSLGGYLSSSAYGDAAPAVTQLSSLPSMESTAPGIKAFKSAMAASFPKSTLNNVSLRAWTASDVFIKVASKIDGKITSKSVYDQLLKSTNIQTDGITADIDFAKPKPYGSITREFNTSFEASKLQGDKLTTIGGGLFDGLSLIQGG